MKATQLVLLVLYIGYLVQVGLLLIVLPWSQTWTILLLRLPAPLMALLDNPALRGGLTAFGALHLGMIALEFGRVGGSARGASTRP